MNGLSNALLVPGIGGGNVVSSAIADAFSNLKLNASYADTIAAHLVTQKPDLNGTVHDETSGRKSRIELSARASGFSTNEHFTGDVDIAGATEITVSSWIRHGAMSANRYIMGIYDDVNVDRAFLFGVITAGVPYASFYGLDGTAQRSIEAPINITEDSEWHLFTVTYDMGTDEILAYLDGKDITADCTIGGSAITSINANSLSTDFTVGTLKQIPTLYQFQGQIQLPVIDKSIWTPAQVRDFYQNKVDEFSPTYIWFLNGDQGDNLVGGDALTPSASPPTLHEDAECPDYLNKHGWNLAYNLATYSEEFNFGSTLARVTVDVNDTENHLGDLTADKVVETSDTGTHDLRKSSQFTTSTQYTISVYAKAGERQHLGVRLGSSLALTAGIDLSDGTVYYTGSSIDSISVEEAGNGWYKITATGIANATTLYFFLNETTATTNGSYAGDGTSGLYLWGLQVVEGDTISPYYKTRATVYDNVVVPKQLDAELDANEFAALDSNSFGKAKCQGQLIDGPCMHLNGSDELGSLGTASLLGSDSFTLIFGISPDTSPNQDDRILANQTGSLASGGLYITHKDNRLRIVVNDGVDAFEAHTFNGVMTTGQSNRVAVRVNRVTNTTAFFVDGVEQELEDDSIDWTAFGTLDTSDNYVLGAEGEGETTANFDGKLWDFRFYDSALSDAEILAISTTGESDTTPTRHYPISEEAGGESTCVITGESITWTGGTWGLQDSFFYSDNKGCSVVPIFADPVELVSSTNINFDGVMECTVELDFAFTTTGSQTLFCQGSVAPIRIRTSGSTVQVFVRNSLNQAIGYNSVVLTVGELYRLKIVITEHSTDPENLSSIVVTDRLTGEVLHSRTDADIAMSQLGISNNGNTQIGSYANATQSFLGDLYRVRLWTEGTLRVSVDFPSYTNGGTSNDLSESDGTLDFRKIPAKEDGSGNDANGYPLNHAAGPHINSQASLKICNVDESSSQRERFYGGEFTGVVGASVNADTDIPDYPFSVSIDAKMNSGSSQYLISVSPNTAQYHQIYQATLRRIYGQRRGGGIGPESKNSGALVIDDQWMTHKIILHSATSFEFIVDGESFLFTGETSVPFPAAATTLDLWIGQFRSIITETPSFEFKNIIAEYDGTVVNQIPAYRGSLDMTDDVRVSVDTDVQWNSETELVVESADATTNTHYHERDSKGRITKSIAIAG